MADRNRQVDVAGKRKLDLLNERRVIYQKYLDQRAREEAKAAKRGARGFFFRRMS